VKRDHKKFSSEVCGGVDCESGIQRYVPLVQIESRRTQPEGILYRATRGRITKVLLPM
jgi:hypothetical protein